MAFVVPKGMNDDERLQALKSRIERLDREHPDVNVAPPLGEDEAAAIEAKYGFEFPNQLRAFFTTVCAGLSSDEYYGLRTLDQVLKDLEEQGATGRLSRPFPFGTSRVQECWDGMRAFRQAGRKGKPDYFISGNPERSGVLQLFEAGPDGHYHVVLNGEQAGKIWEAPESDLWFPSERNDTEPITQADVITLYDALIRDYEAQLDQKPDPNWRPEPVQIPKTQTFYGFANSPNGQIPDGIWDATHLERLMLTSNNLTELPDELGRLVNLRELDVSGNPLHIVPPLIAKLQSLEVLNLMETDIDHLPDFVFGLGKLKALRVGSNRIGQVPSQLETLVSLERLSLEHNPIRTVPRAVFTMPELQAISLRGTLVPSEQVEELRAARPALRIVY